MSDWQAPYFYNQRAYNALARLKWYRQAASTLGDAAVVVGGLAANTYLYKRLYNEISDWSDDFQRPSKMGRTGGTVQYQGANQTSAMDCEAGEGENVPVNDRQYISIVRTHKSRFGGKKAYTKKRIIRDLKRDQFIIRSRFHHFTSASGYATGLGGRMVNTLEPSSNTAGGLLPFLIYDVTSLPWSAGSGTGTCKIPVRQYQLGYNTSNFATGEMNRIGWTAHRYADESPSHMLDQTTNLRDRRAIAVATETHGYHPNQTTVTVGAQATNFPCAKGFRHDWSDISMVLYPQNGLPTRWHVALVSFPNYLMSDNAKSVGSAGPPLQYMDENGTYVNTTSLTTGNAYSVFRTSNTPEHDNLDLRWQKFFSGKLKNPINTDSSAVGHENATTNGLPFKIIKHESFMQPARDHPDFNGNAQRLIKRLFYRRDWEFSPVLDNNAIDQGDAMLNMNTVQTNNGLTANATSNPFPKTQEIVYLAIWTENYKSAVNGNSHVTMADLNFSASDWTFPSFDLVVKMKHTLDSYNMDKSEAVVPDVPVAPP